MNVARYDAGKLAEGVLSGDLADLLAHRLERQLARRQEQRELLDLLVRGEEVALDAVGEEAQGLGLRALLLARQARADPLGEPRPVDREDVDNHPPRLERLEPRRRLPRAIEARQHHHGEGVRRQVLAVRFDGLRALGPRLARGDPQLDQLALAEERHARRVRRELAPVEAALGGERHALGKSLLARFPADRVARLEGQERLVAVDHVQGAKLAREVAVQLLGPEGGHLFGLRMRRHQPPHDLLHHVGLHVAVQQRLLGFLGDDLRVVVAHVAREDDLARRQEHLQRLGIGDAEADAVAQAVFVHLAGRGERKDGLLACLVGEAEHRLSLLRVVDDARLARGGDVALELDRERCRTRDVERLERQRRRAAQMESAAGEEGDRKDEEHEAHHTTTLTRRPGTTTTFFTGLPSAKRTTASWARAMRSISSRLADLGTRMCPRSLPLTWRTSSISSCSSADLSTTGQGAVTRSPYCFVYPKSFHNPWVT